MSKYISGLSENSRFWVIDSTDVVKEALEIHKVGPTAISALGRVLTAALMMGHNLTDKDLLTLRFDCEGPIKMLVATTTHEGTVRGFVGNCRAEAPLKDDGKPDVGAIVGGGTLHIIKDMGLKEPYVGVSNIQTGEIAEDLAYYYFTSEQTPTVIGLGVSLNKDFTVKNAGGFMIQLMPDEGMDSNQKAKREMFISKLEEKIKAIRPVTELMDGGMDIHRIAKLLYEDMEKEDALVEDYKILKEQECSYRCDCSKEKFFRKILSIGKEEIYKTIEANNGIEVECHFCKTKYQYSKTEFDLIFNAAENKTN